MKKLKTLLIFGLMICLIVLTACSDTTSSDGGSKGSGDEKITLTYGIWDKNQAPALEKIAEKFKEKNPNITVKVEVTPWDQYWTKLESAATGNSLPDLFWLNAVNIQKYGSGGVLLPITEQIKNDGVDLSKYPKALVETYTVDGENYALPKDYDTIGLWYNKELFDAAGVSYPDDSWTWDDVLNAAKKITDPSKDVWGIAAQLANQAGFYNTIYQAGGFVINDGNTESGYDTQANLDGIKFWTDMLHKHKVSPTMAQMTDTTALAFFESGKVAMLYAGSWMSIEFSKNEYTKDKVDVAVLPKGKQRAVIIHGLGNVIAKNTKHPEAAWKFSKFLGSEEAHKIQAETGTVIPAYEGTQEAWVKAIPQFNLQAFIDMAEYAVPYPASIKSPKWQKIETDILTQVWNGDISPEDGVQQIDKGIEEVLATE
jgi:multiple sugar transport system substrate-binding protein